MDWKADQLRGVLFSTTGNMTRDAMEVWRDLSAGQSPDSFQRPVGSPIASSVAEGTLADRRFSVTVQPGRIDIAISAPAPVENEPSQIDDIEPALHALLGVIVSVRGEMKVSRVAMVSQVSRRLKNGEKAADLLKAAAGIEYPLRSSDNIYQFNVRKPYDCAPNIGMNRICTWSTGLIRIVQAQIDMNNPGMSVSSIPAIEFPIIGLRTDINSATTSEDVTNYTESMLSEHLNESVAIMSKGIGHFQ